MWLRVLELSIIILSVYGVYRWITKSMKTADVENKVEELESLEKEVKIIKKAKKKHKKTRSKRNVVSKFKKQ